MDSKRARDDDEPPNLLNASPVVDCSIVLQPETMKKAKMEKYSNKGLSSTLSQALKQIPILVDRVVARRRVWNQETNEWEKWVNYAIRNDCHGERSKTFTLNRGGKLKFFAQLIPDIASIQKEMTDCKYYRQYSIRSSLEPRVHALFSNKRDTNSPQTGYQYGSVNMQAHPLKEMNHLAELSSRLARRFKLPSNEWNIGLDVLIYRDGKDSINWHADDTQDEDIVLCLTVETPKDARTVSFQPSLKEKLHHGDEQIELFPIAGDAYQMDGLMQKGYVHAIMKLPTSKVNSGKRMAIVFRNGKETHIDQDNGYLLSNIDAPERLTKHTFGPMTDTLIEGQLYSREYLYRSGAHFNERGGVSGSRNNGCPSIVVTRVSPELGEFDAFLYISYYAEPRQRSGALLTSYEMKLPVRVFRSSKGIHGQFHPSSDYGQRVFYRYDGVYYIISVKQRNGNDTSQQCGQIIGNIFYLVRSEPQSEMLHLQTQHPNFQPFNLEDDRCCNIQKASDICQSQLNPMHYKNWLDQSLQLSEPKRQSHEV